MTQRMVKRIGKVPALRRPGCGGQHSRPLAHHHIAQRRNFLNGLGYDFRRKSVTRA